MTALGIVLGACLVLPYESRTLQPALRPYLEPEAYRVYEAILPQNPAYTDAVSALIRGKTISYDADCLQPDVRYRARVTAAIADYKRKNRSNAELQPLFHLTKSYEILAESEFIGTPIRPRNSSRWRQYLLRHPNFPGFIELSQVGFNKDKTIAVVYMVHNCGVMCSGGDVLVLAKEGGRWRSLDMRGFVCFWRS